MYVPPLDYKKVLVWGKEDSCALELVHFMAFVCGVARDFVIAVIFVICSSMSNIYFAGASVGLILRLSRCVSPLVSFSLYVTLVLSVFTGLVLAAIVFSPSVSATYRPSLPACLEHVARGPGQ